MGITRKQALKRIDGLIGENAPTGIDAHIAKLTRRGGGPHVRAELNAKLNEIERLLPHAGKRTAEVLSERVAQWRQTIAEIEDVDY